MSGLLCLHRALLKPMETLEGRPRAMVLTVWPVGHSQLIQPVGLPMGLGLCKWGSGGSVYAMAPGASQQVTLILLPHQYIFGPVGIPTHQIQPTYWLRSTHLTYMLKTCSPGHWIHILSAAGSGSKLAVTVVSVIVGDCQSS